MKPKISVIIRTHNSAIYVTNAIESVLNQTLTRDKYEILVVDDGSTDNTKEILEAYRDYIYLFEQKNLGPIKALNRGISLAKGDYIIILDSDDTYEPGILKEMYDVLDREMNVGFIYCDYFERKRGDGEVRIISLKDNIFNSVACGFLFRKSIIDEMGGYDENLIFPEYDLLIKIMKKYKGRHIAKPLFTYIRHNESLTADRKFVEKGFKQLSEKYGNITNFRGY